MARPPRPLHGQVAAVTGAARGIGRATAARLARAGMRVALGDLDGDLAAEEAARLDAGAIGLPLDVTDSESFEAFLAAVEERLGPLDVLVNNAGIMHLSRFVDEDDAAAARQIDINLVGVITGSRLALRRFNSRGRGHLVNIASTAGKYGAPGGATYAATKHAVVGLSEALRGEHHGTAIEVSCVMPGVVRTELAAGLGEVRGVRTVAPDDVGAAIVETLRHPRFDVYVPKEVGRAVWFAALLPRRLREALTRRLRSDRILAAVDPAERRAYELRAARSDPRLGRPAPGARSLPPGGSGP
jgi:NAD(P)-dependent dehydrogenase (short-subunit alcohol dehydrogenase family)